MVIQPSAFSNTAAQRRHGRLRLPGRGRWLQYPLFFVGLSAIGAIAFAYNQNIRRDLLVEIRNAERQQKSLQAEYTAASARWASRLNAASLELRLAQQGIDMTLPDAKQVVMVSPNPTSPRPPFATGVASVATR